LLAMPAARRQRVEEAEARRVAEALAGCLPRDEAGRAQRLEVGYALAARMSWETVVREYLLAGLGRAAGPR